VTAVSAAGIHEGRNIFTSVLAKFVRGKIGSGIEEAVRKMAAMAAAGLGLNDRGLIKPE